MTRYSVGFVGKETIAWKLVLAIVLAGLGTLPRSANAQTHEERTVSVVYGGYLPENVGVRRARSGLIGTGVAVGFGGVLFGISYIDVGFTPRRWVDPVRFTGVFLMAGGAAGMIATGILLGVRKRKLRLQEADYGRPRRAHWDLARSRLVF